MTLDELNALPTAAAIAEFRQCCASTLWADVMEALRPFPSRTQLLTEARKVWGMLSEEDWREAFQATESNASGDGLARAAEAQAQVTQARLEQAIVA